MTVFARLRRRKPIRLDNGRSDTPPDACRACRGSGEIVWNLTWPRDPQADETATCPACQGTGARS